MKLFVIHFREPLKIALSRRFRKFLKMALKRMLFEIMPKKNGGMFFVQNVVFKCVFIWKCVFWSWKVTNFFGITPNFLPQIKFFLQKSSKINKCRLVVKLLRQISSFAVKVHRVWINEFYGCKMIFDEVMIFWKNKFLSFFFFSEKIIIKSAPLIMFFPKKKQNYKNLFFQNIIISSKMIVQPLNLYPMYFWIKRRDLSK